MYAREFDGVPVAPPTGSRLVSVENSNAFVTSTATVVTSISAVPDG